MVWWTTDWINNYYMTTGGLSKWVDERCYEVNNCRDESLSSLDLLFARPSSYHVAGVVASYADGHQDFMDDEIDYLVFCRLMAPDDNDAGL
jgi:hypothetical protein